LLSGLIIAAEICTHLDEDTVVSISREMARIEKLTPQDKEELLGEFILELQKMKRTSHGGEEFAKKILVDALWRRKAREIYKKVEVARVDDAFEFLEQADPEIVVRLVGKEHPQAVAVMLAYMNPTKAGLVISIFPAILPVMSPSVSPVWRMLLRSLCMNWQKPCGKNMRR
jgi:flagellar motor switch protein FliG